jgi:hypothetical protein
LISSGLKNVAHKIRKSKPSPMKEVPKRDEVLKRMLKTPPKPRRAAEEKPKPRKPPKGNKPLS